MTSQELRETIALAKLHNAMIRSTVPLPPTDWLHVVKQYQKAKEVDSVPPKVEK